MRKGVKNFCNGDDSTSTLNQQNANNPDTPSVISSPCILNNADTAPPTLEHMILQLELEEEIARNARRNDVYAGLRPGRMSCVNSSDILRSARNALNQLHPRFSLDGRDAMYRSSFQNLDSFGKAHGSGSGRKSVCCDHGLRERMNSKFARNSTLAGENVVWCKPGVVAKLMGLEAMPVPINSRRGKETLSSVIRRQNLRRRAERHEMERRFAMDLRNCTADVIERGRMASCSKAGYCVMKPVAVQSANTDGGGWPTRRFH